ncbi:MAG: hypothetical protein V3U49_01300 [Nitrososphaerales archaeon]
MGKDRRKDLALMEIIGLWLLVVIALLTYLSKFQLETELKAYRKIRRFAGPYVDRLVNWLLSDSSEVEDALPEYHAISYDIPNRKILLYPEIRDYEKADESIFIHDGITGSTVGLDDERNTSLTFVPSDLNL